MSCVNVIMRVRKVSDSGPVYVTICLKPTWKREGIMLTSSTWDATKFHLKDNDAYLFCNYLNSTSEDKFEVVPIDKRHLATRRNQYWEDKSVHCDFKETRLFNNTKL